jgi:MFS family permease
LALLAAFLFPAIFITLPPLVSVFVIGMITWGVYYELLQFSHFNFIRHHVPKANYHQAWGTLSSFKALAYILGPLICGLIIASDFKTTFTLSLVFYSFAALGFFLLATVIRRRPLPPEPEPLASVKSEFKIWTTLFKKVWLIYIFLFLISVIDSAFWTVGTLVSEELRHTSGLGSLFLPAYTLPALFVGLAISRLPSTGKKRTALLTGSLAGLILALVGLTPHPLALILIVFTSSVFLSISYPEIEAVFEDYVSRLGTQGTNMVGLQSSAISASYIVGPILAGALAQVFGNRPMFTILGLAVAGYSLLIFFIIPRKIRLPEAEIAQI